MRSFFTVCLRLIFSLSIFSVWFEGLRAEPSADALPAEVMESLQRFCFECHGEKKAKKDLRLNQFETLESVLREKRLWGRVLAHLRDGEMPPEEADVLPTREERASLVSEIEGMLAGVDWVRYRRPGREGIARLTRMEYRNTMSDLLGLDLHPDGNFAEDGEGESGFRNDRASLQLGAVQVEKYLEAAEAAVDGVMGLALSFSTMNKKMAADVMERSMPRRMKAHRDGMVLANPGQELSADFEFPFDGYYRVKLRASAMGQSSVALLRIEGRVAAEIAVSGEELNKSVWSGLMFVRKGRHRLSIENKNLFPQRSILPPGAAGIAVREGERNHPRLSAFINEDARLKSERESFNQRSAGVQEAYEWLRLLGVRGDSREIDRFRNYAWQRGKGLAKALRKLADLSALKEAELAALWEKENRVRLADNAHLLDRVKAVQWADWMSHQGKVFLTSIEIEGPVFEDENYADSKKLKHTSDDATLLALMEKWDRSDEGALDLLRRFLPLVFRRSLEKSEQDRYVERYHEFRKNGGLEDEALRLTLMAILSSPEFLYRDERGDDSGGQDESSDRAVEALDDWSLASRLSYFLWSTMPDQPLFRLANEGKLDEKMMRQQADRMLEDERARVFFRSFVGQWLGIDSLGKTVLPDARQFPEFTPVLAEMMKAETVKYVESVFADDRALTDLLDSEWTFLNEDLAEHYGISGVRGQHLRRVKLTDRRRGGLLGMGSVLTVTSSPARTNPMRRGFWVLEGLLGDRLGEPPGDAGELPGDAGAKRGKTLREEIELHRTRKSCMSCHVKLDPIGFALQNFDALGRWRDEEAGKPVDSSGVMPDGRKFNGPVELKQVLLERKDEFVKNLCERMLSYALGRKLEYYDEAEVRRIFAQVKKEGYRARTLIREVVVSYPFRYRDVSE